MNKEGKVDNLLVVKNDSLMLCERDLITKDITVNSAITIKFYEPKGLLAIFLGIMDAEERIWRYWFGKNGNLSLRDMGKVNSRGTTLAIACGATCFSYVKE
ncbi:MAG: hypothetical protein ACI85I_000159 [Arenicella sp.]|jgi:hypothetical protein